MIFRYSAAGDPGKKRKHNEDRYIIRRQPDGSLLLAVADGLGGMPEGEKAAETAMEILAAASLEKKLVPDMLYQLALTAHNTILGYTKGDPELEGAGTTLTAALVQDTLLSWVHVGDSRLYRLREKKLFQLTTDHRFLSCFIAGGDITPEEASRHPFRNVLDQCLGCPKIEPECGSIQLRQGDLLLLCTDGLSDELPLKLLEKILSMGISAEMKVQKLLEAALEAGGKDNITLIVADSHSC